MSPNSSEDGPVMKPIHEAMDSAFGKFPCAKAPVPLNDALTEFFKLGGNYSLIVGMAGIPNSVRDRIPMIAQESFMAGRASMNVDEADSAPKRHIPSDAEASRNMGMALAHIRELADTTGRGFDSARDLRTTLDRIFAIANGQPDDAPEVPRRPDKPGCPSCITSMDGCPTPARCRELLESPSNVLQRSCIHDKRM